MRLKVQVLLISLLLTWVPATLLARPVRGVIGEDSKKIRQTGQKIEVWAGNEEWFDFTDAAIPAGKLQYGIGKDRIRAIDDPLYVSADDPRLLEIPPSSYRPRERPKTNDDIMVIGVAIGKVAYAYPIALLDHHELVNDTVSGKPVTVGW